MKALGKVLNRNDCFFLEMKEVTGKKWNNFNKSQDYNPQIYAKYTS